LRRKNLAGSRRFEEEFFGLTIYQTDNRQIDYYERIDLIR
jgi:hypothetical protein